MPREYIVRLVLDRRHKTLVLLRSNTVVGAVCYRPFYEQQFAEIVFLAVTSSRQGRVCCCSFGNPLFMAQVI